MDLFWVIGVSQTPGQAVVRFWQKVLRNLSNDPYVTGSKLGVDLAQT